MGRHERAAKTSLKEATALASGIIDTIRHDLRREEVRLEDEMRDSRIYSNNLERSI